MSSKLNGVAVGVVAKTTAGVLLLVLMVAWTAGCFQDRVAPGRLDVARGRELPAGVVTLVASNELVASSIELPGTVASERTIHLSARISAYVKDVQASAGQEVKAGQTLIVLDDRELQEQLRAAEAQLNQARTEFERSVELLGQQATTQQAHDAAQSRFLASKAAVEQVRVMLSYTRIVAPIDGVVTDRRVEVGDLANPGQLLAAVYDPARMRLEIPVPVRLLDQLPQGQEIQVQLERPDATLAGRVSEIVSQVDPATRTQLVKAMLDADAVVLLPGTYGRVLLPLDPHEAILVPVAAITQAGQLEFVEEVRDGRAIRVLVRSGLRHGDRVELLAGLTAGSTIVMPAAEGM